ncbi:MAG TPA: GNAT family N-acetyltransferase [Lactobacillaceae bacterium]
MIKPITLADAPALYTWIEDDKSGSLGQFLPFLREMKSLADEERFIAKMLAIPTVKMWTIRADDDTIIGEMLLHSYDQTAKTAKLGYWLARPFRRQGYTVRAITAVLQEVDLTTVQIEAAADNFGSQAVALKAGFTQIGAQTGDDGKPELVFEKRIKKEGVENGTSNLF